MNHLNKGVSCRSPTHSTKLVAVNVFLNFSFTIFRIIDSNVFGAIIVREIGLTFFSIVFVGFTFGTGITFADFRVSGIIPSRHELLKIALI